jgi:tetratricopeptide (TPR) repeat protein
MSLLLEALKKAEKAKEEAQKRSREDEPEGTGELRLADDAPPAVPAANERRVVTRDELPPITSPLEIQSEDIGSEPAAAAGSDLALQGAPRPAPSRPRQEPQAQTAQRAAARKPIEAKMREPNPRLPFFITMGVLGAACVGTVAYFWIQLSPPPSTFNANPKPPSGESPVAPVTQGQGTAPTAAGSASSTAIPGLPGAAVPPAEVAPPPAPPRAETAAAAPVERSAPRKPRARAPAAQDTPAPRPVRAAVAHSRPPARIHPLVSSGYAAYQAGDMERARGDYAAALRDEPANRDALLGLAAVETRAQRFSAAEALYRRLLLADPKDPHAQAGLLGLRSGETNPVSAESRLKGLIANDSGESVLYFSLGNQFARQARWPEAQQAYGKAAAIDPDNADYAYNHAVSLEHVRQPQAALRQYRRALVLGLQRTASFDPTAAQERVQALSR